MIMMSSSSSSVNAFVCDVGQSHEPETITADTPPSDDFANVVSYLYTECEVDEVNMAEEQPPKANDSRKRIRKPTHKGEAYKKKASVGRNKKGISVIKIEKDGNLLVQQMSEGHQNVKKENLIESHQDLNEEDDPGCIGSDPTSSNQKKTKQKINLAQGSHSHSADKKRYGKLYNKRTMGGSNKGNGCRPTFCCLKCPKKFSRLTLLKNHFHTHNESTETTEPANMQFKQCSWVCDICCENFKSARALRFHMQRQHDLNPSSPTSSAMLQCQLCSSTFTHTASFKVHMRAHRGEKPYHCTECEAEFVQSGHLMIHKRIHTGEKPYTCDICSMQFKQISHLKTHVRTHTLDKPYKCTECKAAFAQNSSLKRHKRSHTGEKPYKCDVCGMTFVVKSNLQRHSYTHTGEKPYSCDLCSASFGQVIDLKRHKISHTGIKPFKCDLCEAQFSRNNNLKWHRLTHAEGAPFKCDACGVNFATVGDFRFHKRSHEPPRPFQCPVCPASFQQSCSLNNHQLIHTSEFPSLKKSRQKSKVCGISCNKAGIKPYECTDCNASFCEKRNLRRHVISRHSTSRQLAVGTGAADKNAGSVSVQQQLTPVSLSEVWQVTQTGDTWPKLKQEALTNDEGLSPKCETFAVSYGNHDSMGADHSSTMFADVVDASSSSVVAEHQHGLSVLAPGLVTLQQQQQQYSQLIAQGLASDTNSTNGGNISVVNGGTTSVIVNNTSVSGGDVTSGSTVIASNPSMDADIGNTLASVGSSGLVSQLIISTGPNEPARQARPAGNCPNHSAHFLTLVDAAANHWQAWCLCETATLGQFGAANVSLVGSSVNHSPSEAILSEGVVVPISSTPASTTCSQQQQQQQHSISPLKNLYTSVASSSPAIRNTFSSVISSPGCTNNNTVYTTSTPTGDLNNSSVNSFQPGCIISTNKDMYQQQHPDNGNDGSSVNNSNSIMIVPTVNGNNITVLQSASAMTSDHQQQQQQQHVNNGLTIESLQPSAQLLVSAELTHQQTTTVTPGMLLPV